MLLVVMYLSLCGVLLLSLGLAKHCTDGTEAVIKLAGKHKGFDLNASL